MALECMGRSVDLSKMDPAFWTLRTEIVQLENDLRALTANL